MEDDQGEQPPTTQGSAKPAGVTTRSQQQQQQQQRRATEDAPAVDDSEANSDDGQHQRGRGKGRDKEKQNETFTGGITNMGGHVFQLSEEGRKANQFTKTMETLRDYTVTYYEHAADLVSLFEIPSRGVVIPEPEDEPPLLDPGDAKSGRAGPSHRGFVSWKRECTAYDLRNEVLNANLLKLFTVVLLQSSPSVRAKLEATKGYEKARTEYDCPWLFNEMRNICHHFEHTENRYLALHKATSAIINYKQGANQNTTDYYEVFKELVAVLESYGGRVHHPAAAAPGDGTVIASVGNDKAQDAYMREHCLAATFLHNSDNARYGQLKAELSNDFTKGRDEYPVTLVGASQMLLRYKSPNEPAKRRHDNAGRGRGGRGPDGGRSGGGAPDGGRGAGRWPHQGGRGRGGNSKQSGRNFFQTGFSLAQLEEQVNNLFPDGIPSHFVLLDSASTVSIFCNPDLLTDIHDVDRPLLLETNGGGEQLSYQMGTLRNFGSVWYNPDSIANILSLAEVRKVRRVTATFEGEAAFHVHKADGSGSTVFSEHESGLYLHDTQSPPNPTPSSTVTGYSYLQTAANNKKMFTRRQVNAADEARKLYHMMGRPGIERFLRALTDNHIINCPITSEDAKRAETIYGKDVAFLKGKTTASPAKEHLADFEAVPLPSELLSLHQTVTLCCDIFYVLGQTFSLSTSRNIRYMSCRPMADRTKKTITGCITSDLKMYQDRGFVPTEVHADGEYNSVSESFAGVHFSICSADDHVPEAERAIRTTKETIRSAIHGMPYKRIPLVMIKELVTFAAHSNNMLPSSDGISDTLSPATIVTGSPKDDYRSMKLEIGSYVQVYDGTSNDTKSRTLGAITLNPTGNSSGDYYFMSLATGRKIHRRSWTELPISEAAISRVEAIALEEGMPTVDEDNMISEYDPDAIADESAYDKDYQPPVAPDRDSDHELTTDAYTSSSDSSKDEEADDFDDEGHHAEYDDYPTDIPAPEEPAAPTEEEEREAGTMNGAEERETPPEEEEERDALLAEQEERETQPAEQEERATAQPGPPQRSRRQKKHIAAAAREKGLRPKRDPNYQYRYGFAMQGTTVAQAASEIPLPQPSPWVDVQQAVCTSPAPVHDDGVPPDADMRNIRKAIFGLLFNQMSAHKGIKRYGQIAWDALKKEFEQFKAMDVLEPLDAFQMADEQKAEALRALSVIKEKRDGRIKGRTVADGSSQRGKYTKEETGSPTISSDALFLTILIDAYENRDVATADITGAYLHAHMKDFVCLRFTGWAVDLLCEVNPEYAAYVVYEGKTKVLYTRCNKAIYGCVQSGLLWYDLFTSTLEGEGYKLNPYDFCVANAIVQGSQSTVGWYVDDTKMSHMKPAVNDRLIGLIEAKFGKMTVTRGKHHHFLGMDITYHGDGTASIHMPSYLQEAIDDSGLIIAKDAPSPCASGLLTIDKGSPILGKKRAETFHSIVAKLIYVGTRARTDILLSLAFLCGRVREPTEQDEKKLRRLLEYLRGTKDLALRLGADSLNKFMTWVDASFAIHPDMRSHTGGVISFGRGGIICKSRKQRLNCKSSTEAELIGASDYLPHTLYVKMFMEAQGYPIDTTIFYQDNESAIKMERNGKASCGQRSRHIDIRYFFITDHCKRRNIDIVHCPTEDMLADYFTKPLQGSLFRKFRSVLLGHAHISSLNHHGRETVNEERVESGNPEGNPEEDPVRQPEYRTHYGGTLSTAMATHSGSCAVRAVRFADNDNHSIKLSSHSIQKSPEN